VQLVNVAAFNHVLCIPLEPPELLGWSRTAGNTGPSVAKSSGLLYPNVFRPKLSSKTQQIIVLFPTFAG